MRAVFDRLEQFAVDVILERRYGKRAALLRVVLLLLSHLYAQIMRLRLWVYEERLARPRPVGCLVISIGNLTVGGTGKTPVVEKFARALSARGRSVAVLSRGYKSKSAPWLERVRRRIGVALGELAPPPRVVSDGKRVLLDATRAGDEPVMLASNLPGVRVLVDKDRVKSALYAMDRWGIDTLLLDDGFQYLPLKQRVDVVLIDRQAPFGNEYLLPRGTLREPPGHLKRADVIFITKCHGRDNATLKERIRQHNRHAEIIECRHVPLYCQNVYTEERLPLEFLNERRIAAISGIAQPDSFESFLRTLGAEIVHARQYADHHRYSKGEILSMLAKSRRLRAKAIVTTEKDAVRLPPLDPEQLPVPILFLRVEVRAIGGEAAFERVVDRICAGAEGRHPAVAVAHHAQGPESHSLTAVRDEECPG